MEVILCKDLERLGSVGDVVKVKDGFARNFLFPKKMAYSATPANIKRIEREKAQRQDLEAQKQKEAEILAERLSKVSCTVSVEVNDLDQLYGSVTESDIAKALELEDYSIDKKSIVLERHIDELGIYEIGVKLHPHVTAKIKVWVTKK